MCDARGVPLPASKTQINKAGQLLRDTATGQRIVTEEDYQRSLMLVREYRAAHSYPLTSVAMALRHHARKAADGGWYDVGQRLKQFATIRDKLVRMPKTNLARMQDLGGCRAVFMDQDTVDAAIHSILHRATVGDTWEIVDLDDYVNEKRRVDGYRAKHLIVLKHELQIEIQFRTTAQHNWAQLVEELDKALGLGMKQGQAPDWALAAVAAAARDMRQYEEGDIERPELIALLNESLAPLLALQPQARIV